ncbi:hypothetical protein FLONG3_1085 [Fusarium longipes]|uniref:Apple domain-containing protein n=1 Tax=Fusarium longipes TaxID=694270 RepID=A0A395T944_9HYPO|nr:hypothetical protein FLONG3_1085 [Fusarium longipes]
MKSSIFLPLVTLLASQGASAACVSGHIETISPDYQVEYKCDQYRTGTSHKKIASEHDCALLCKDTESVCSYSPGVKVCVVGDESGQDKEKPGVIYMTKYKDPFAKDDEKDPFLPDCEAEKQDLLDEIVQLKKDAASGQGSNGSGSCVHLRDPVGQQEIPTNRGAKGFESCQKLCQASPECKSFYYYGCNSICRHFGKSVEEMNTVHNPTTVLMNKDCAITL